ncbi:2-hydroxyglutaryl-CoA dehydratase [candidate division LCP-89 bacterium B3_LCP]|uniref:2-hydroxyglutaryl-CoA dehydratase n=1 Tax=candidate division LCP-89 bacterium B3_LCP TaxID=2012998 RepID=A0A532UW30_UNCL8|nr:MAG: 2-hydroxyglutaryl-CoA dehydratase [candidate division LCP-89 bacterium B3_LCP]
MPGMKKSGDMTVGIDIGSRTTKALVWNGEEVLSRSMLSTGWTPEKSASVAFEKTLQTAAISPSEVKRTMVTGYGRGSISFADESVTEITAHARGVSYLLPETKTLIDIGGQDSKAIIIDDEALVQDFAMNDRCAAGSGKFLEFLALTMELSVQDFSELAFSSKNPMQISSICTVFAESEVLSMLAEGVAREDVASGVHRSIALRVAQMAHSLHPQVPIAFSGGVARNRCMIREIGVALGGDISVPEMPEYAGALGAAIIARESL